MHTVFSTIPRTPDAVDFLVPHDKPDYFQAAPWRHRLLRLDRQFDCTLLTFSRILSRRGLAHRTHLVGCVMSCLCVSGRV